MDHGIAYVAKDTVTGLYYTGQKVRWGKYDAALRGTKTRIRNIIGGLRNGTKNQIVCVPCVEVTK